MKFDVITIFPGMVEAFLADGVVGRAASRGLIDVGVHDLRDFASDRYRTVDDVPYGGRSGHGDEAGAIRAGDGPCAGRKRDARCGGPDLTAGETADAW